MFSRVPARSTLTPLPCHGRSIRPAHHERGTHRPNARYVARSHPTSSLVTSGVPMLTIFRLCLTPTPHFRSPRPFFVLEVQRCSPRDHPCARPCPGSSACTHSFENGSATCLGHSLTRALPLPQAPASGGAFDFIQARGCVTACIADTYLMINLSTALNSPQDAMRST